MQASCSLFQQNLKNRVDELPTKDDLNNLDIYVKWPQLEEALNARRSRAPSAKSRASTPKARTPTPPPPRMSSPPHPSPEALEALRQIGELMDRHEMLIEQVDALEVCKYLYLIYKYSVQWKYFPKHLILEMITFALFIIQMYLQQHNVLEMLFKQ